MVDNDDIITPTPNRDTSSPFTVELTVCDLDIGIAPEQHKITQNSER